MMVQDMLSLGQFRLPQNYPALGNFPNQYFPPTGAFTPAMPHFQPPPDWNTIIRAAVAAQTSHLQKEVEQMRSLIEGTQNTCQCKQHVSQPANRRMRNRSPEKGDRNPESQAQKSSIQFFSTARQHLAGHNQSLPGKGE